MVLAPRSVAACLLALCLLAQAVLACQKSKSDGARAAAAPALGRYWLTHTKLHSGRAYEKGFMVTTPTLVELLPRGRVRSLPGAQPKFEGSLPPEVLQEPQSGRGLMLYAKRVTEIRWRSPGGPLYGHLHPGALVSVVPTEDASVRIGNLPFGHDGKPSVVYVARSGLGIEPREPTPLSFPADSRTVRWSVSIGGWLADPDEPHLKLAWNSVPCEDVWVSRDRKRVSQYIRGVEAVGLTDGLPAAWPTIKAGGGLDCPLRTVTQRDSHLPDGYRTFELPAGDPLGHALDHGASLHWLVDDGSGPQCDKWSFELRTQPARSSDAHQRKGRLVRSQPLHGERVWFPMSYLPSEGRRPSVVHLGTIMVGGHGTLKCECESYYALLGVDGDELELLDLPAPDALPDDLIAYDPSQTERWFLSHASCEQARAEAKTAVERDGSLATRLGFHAVTPAFGI